MTLATALGSALLLGLMTAISPCPLATNIAAIGFLGRSVGNTRRVIVSGLLYTLGRTVAYVGLGLLIVYGLQAASDAGGADGEGRLMRWLQHYVGLVVGPVLILAGMVLLNLLQVTGSLNLGGLQLQERVAKGGAGWAFPLGMLFALSFCPTSVVLFGSMIAVARQADSALLPPVAYGVGTAAPVLAFALLMAFAGQAVGRVFGHLTQVERWLRAAVGAVFILAGIYLTLTHIYGLNLSW
jgi:cytochrome c biogenesis protein CcdA